MERLEVLLPEPEAQRLYRLLHRLPDGQDLFVELYLQLQSHFFRTLTIDDLNRLLEADE